MLPDPRVPGVRRIAVLRANALGDFVFALPALDALRAAYPRAEIVLLARAWHAAFLAGRPSPVDRVVALPPGVLAERPATADERRQAAAVLDGLRDEPFDLAIQLHGGGRNSNPVVLGLGARVTAGLATPDAPRLDRTVPYVYYQPEYARWLEVVGLVGAPPLGLAPRIALVDADRQEAAAILGDDPSPLAVLHPGASDPRRRWPARCFGAVAAALHARGLRVCVTGSDAERGLIDEVVEASQGAASGLAGRLTLGGLAATLAAAAVVVSNDTGPLHLAAAVDAPAVGIYWAGNLINGGELTRTGRRVAISWRTTCPVCGMDCTAGRCEHDPSFVAEVTVEEVLAAADELLADRSRG